MRGVKSKNTAIEVRLRKAIHSAGFRYRLHCHNLPGKPDLVFPKLRKIIFVHGCFWHQHKKCPRAKTPSSNVEYWIPKLERNVCRDKEQLLLLKKLGWEVHIVWECTLENFQKALKRAIRFLENPPSPSR
jgi:DNA mismatch endonuclease (patch repair protein)